MLPKVVPQARLWTYDYNSSCYSDNAQQVDVLGLGETFLEMLSAKKDEEVGERPVLFIGSCFGGVVVAQALERASRNHTSYANLLKSTAGVIFLGTPLRGTATASIAEWVAVIRGFMAKETSTTLLQGLKDNASSLDTLIHDFTKMANVRNLQIRCFYETRTTQIGNAVSKILTPFLPEVKLVPKYSACLDGHDRIPLDVRHAMMNKFRGPADVNFRLVSGILKKLADNACNSRGHTKEELKCLRCFSSNYREDKDRNEKRVPGTCEWFLNHSKFLAWRENDTASLLWVSADPGCGKSVLSRTLVDEGLLSPDLRKSSACYFFFKDDDGTRQSGAHALCALLHQLFLQKPALLQHAVRDYEANGDRLTIMLGTLWDILIKCATDSAADDIVCVLDALDECREPARGNLITRLSWCYSAQNKTRMNLKWLVTSRPYHDIERAFHSSIDNMSTIRLKGENESEKISQEIDLVIDHQILSISKNRSPPLEPNVQHDLTERLKKTPHRTYLWLHLILDVIRKSLDSTAPRLGKLINKLPRTVEDAYEKILMKVNDSEFVEPARRLLHIIVAAARPLTLQEMNIAFAIDERLETEESCKSYSDLDLDSEESFREKVRNICGLFVTIIDSKIYLIHQTAREFLMSEDIDPTSTNPGNSSSRVWRHSLDRIESNLILLKICQSCLLLDELNHQSSTGIASFSCTTRLYRFFDYAAAHWVIHYRQARIRDNKSVLESTLSVCDPQFHRFWNWWLAYLLYVRNGDHEYDLKGATNLIIVSYFGLDALVKILLEQDGVEPNLTGSNGRTPLSWAAKNGHVEVIRLLLEHGVEINLTDEKKSNAAVICRRKRAR